MLATGFFLGLISSLHCLGMCGPIALILPIQKEKKTTKLLKTLTYNLGRICTYSLMGLIFGVLGKGFFLAGFQQRLSILLGVLLLLYTILPQKYFSRIQHSYLGASFFKLVKQKISPQLKKKDHRSLFILGIANGFLPCAMVYIALAGALTAPSIFESIGYMFLYGLGTLPLMMSITYFKSNIKSSFRSKLQKAIPVFICLLGIVLILRGLGYGIPFISPKDVQLQINNNPALCVP